MIYGTNTDEMFLKQRWNAKQQARLSETELTKYFVDKTDEGTPINTLNLNKVYILATRSSASASELLMNGLAPYIEVVHIGRTTRGKNEFSFVLPFTKTNITFKILNGHDEKKIQRELDGLAKIKKEGLPELSTRLKYMITSIEGETDIKHIREFVDKAMLARDSRALREYINTIQPDVDLTFFPEGSKVKRSIPININFFWPDA